MHRLVAALALMFLVVPFVIAQQQPQTDCRLRFVVAQRQDTGGFKIQPDDQDKWGQWPEDARQWWVQDGTSRFAELCEAARTDADLVVAWERAVVTKKVRESVRGYKEEEIGQGCGPSKVCRAGRATEEEVQGWKVRLVTVDRVSVTLYRVEKETQRFVALASLAKESLPNRGAGKTAFVSALEALRKDARKSLR